MEAVPVVAVIEDEALQACGLNDEGVVPFNIQCPICKGSMHKAVTTECCESAFGISCITQWLESHTTCPLCRSSDVKPFRACRATRNQVDDWHARNQVDDEDALDADLNADINVLLANAKKERDELMSKKEDSVDRDIIDKIEEQYNIIAVLERQISAYFDDNNSLNIKMKNLNATGTEIDGKMRETEAELYRLQQTLNGESDTDSKELIMDGPRHAYENFERQFGFLLSERLVLFGSLNFHMIEIDSDAKINAIARIIATNATPIGFSGRMIFGYNNSIDNLLDKIFVALKTNRNITHLILDNNPISDYKKIAEVLEGNSNNNTIRELSLVNTGMSLEHQQALVSRLSGNTYLKKLCFDGGRTWTF